MTRRNEDDQGDWDNQYRMTVIPRNNTGMTRGGGGTGMGGMTMITGLTGMTKVTGMAVVTSVTRMTRVGGIS